MQQEHKISFLTVHQLHFPLLPKSPCSDALTINKQHRRIDGTHGKWICVELCGCKHGIWPRVIRSRFPGWWWCWCWWRWPRRVWASPSHLSLNYATSTMQDGCGLAANPLDITSRGVRNAAFNCMVAHVCEVPLRVNHKVATRITCIAAGLKCKVVAQQKKNCKTYKFTPFYNFRNVTRMAAEIQLWLPDETPAIN